MYIDFELSKKGLWISIKDIFWMFTGLILLKSPKVLKEDLQEGQRYLMLKALERSEQVWSFVYKIYVLKKTENSGTIVLIFLSLSAIKLVILNMYSSYILSKTTQEKHWGHDAGIFTINLISQWSFILFIVAIILLVNSKGILLLLLIIPIVLSSVMFMLTKLFLRYCFNTYPDITYSLVMINNLRFMSINFSFYDSRQIINKINHNHHLIN